MGLYMVSLEHAPERCPGVDLGVRDRVVRMSAELNETLQRRSCEFRGGWGRQVLASDLADSGRPRRSRH